MPDELGPEPLDQPLVYHDTTIQCPCGRGLHLMTAVWGFPHRGYCHNCGNRFTLVSPGGSYVWEHPLRPAGQPGGRARGSRGMEGISGPDIVADMDRAEP